MLLKLKQEHFDFFNKDYMCRVKHLARLMIILVLVLKQFHTYNYKVAKFTTS